MVYSRISRLVALMQFWSWPQRVIMVYCPSRCYRTTPRSEVDLNRSLWYSVEYLLCFSSCVLKLTSTGHYGIQKRQKLALFHRSEVDLNRSLWYTSASGLQRLVYVLKLTSTGHYGITLAELTRNPRKFWSWPQQVIMVYSLMCIYFVHNRSEVDLNRSLWYTSTRTSTRSCSVLKLTSTGHYGIRGVIVTEQKAVFWSWPQQVIMV